MEVLRVPLGAGPGVGDVLRAVRDDARPFALSGRWAGSRAIVGSEPVRVVEGPAVLDVLDEPPVEAPDGVVGGGWFGWLGFGLGAAIERLPPPPPRPCPVPVASMAYYDHVLRLDAEGIWWFEAVTEDGARRLDVLRERLEQPAPAREWALTTLEAAPSATARHTAAVAECVERIAAGELFQANLCLRLEGRFRGSAADAFIDAAAALEPAYGAFVQHGNGAVISLSPELFLRRADDIVTTSPIKGTIARDKGPEALLASAKDAAEHVMIVDLARNDLGRIAEYGTVQPQQRRVEPHPGLWHLVTDVTARVRAGARDKDVIKAAFPPGSVTGAPKIQSLKVIADLEGTQREVYTGAIGFVSPAAGMELNVAIRTLEISGPNAWMGCGGGIVADSNPHAELEEALAKARPIARALGADVHSARPARTDAVTATRWPRRPDPAKGLLETIAVRDGRPIDLDRHLQRLADSARKLWGVELPRIEIPAAEHGRVRVLATPTEVRVELHPDLPSPDPVILEPRTLAGGLGAHKWLDRPPHANLLIVDLDGSVLEASWANVWIQDENGVLVTPPADGRLLPGITRRRLLELPEVETATRRIELFELEQAPSIVLTSSLRLVTPANLQEPPGQAARDLAKRLVHSLTRRQAHCPA